MWLDLGTWIIQAVSIYRSIRQCVLFTLAKMKYKQSACRGTQESYVRNVQKPTLLVTDGLWTLMISFPPSECN